MSVFSPITQILRRTYAAIFRQHLSVRVAKAGVRVVLQDRPAGSAKGQPPSRAELSAMKERHDFALMQQQLAELLDDMPETRATMRHLVFVEQSLERKGLRSLSKLPLDVLKRALEQLEGLVVNWSPVGLATLRSRLAVAIIDRDNQVPVADAEAEAYKTAAVLDTMPNTELQDGLEVHTDDDALAAAYAALGDFSPAAAAVEVQAELGSPGTRTPGREQAGAAPSAEIRVHVLNA